MRYLLDTSALLAHYRQEAGWEQVQALFEQEDATLFLCVLSLTEFGRRLFDLGAHPPMVAETLAAYRVLFDGLINVDEETAHKALEIARATPVRLPLIDSLIAAAAALSGATLVHHDQHFNAVPQTWVATLDFAASSA